MPTTSFVIRHTSALILSVALSLVVMPASVTAAGEEASAVTRHRGPTLNGRPLSQLLHTTVAAEGILGLPDLAEQGTGQISGVALDAEGHPLVDHAVELLVVSEEGAAAAVVARTTTSATGGFSFNPLIQGRYIVDLRIEGQVAAASGVISLAEGGATFTQVGGIRSQPSSIDDGQGKGGLFWTAVGAGVGAGAGLVMMASDPECVHPEHLCPLLPMGLGMFVAILGLMLGAGR